MKSNVRSARILVVDDDPHLLNVFSIALTRAGHLVYVAEDGASAWEMLQVEHYDLLITDNLMPNMSGVELIEKLRSRLSNLPIILATSDVPPDTHKLQLAATLIKPFSLHELVGTINKVLEQSTKAPDEKKLKQFGRNLLFCEQVQSHLGAGKNHELERVCAKLRNALVRIMGLESFQSLMARALEQASEASKGLRSLQITGEGDIVGLSEMESKLSEEAFLEAETLVISHFLGLLVSIIGLTVTLHLVHGIWPKTKDLSF